MITRTTCGAAALMLSASVPAVAGPGPGDTSITTREMCALACKPDDAACEDENTRAYRPLWAFKCIVVEQPDAADHKLCRGHPRAFRNATVALEVRRCLVMEVW